MGAISKAASRVGIPGLFGGTGTGVRGGEHPAHPPVPVRPAHPAQRRVVVGVDGSPGSDEAFVRAASQARQRNALLDVICVIPGDADARAAIMARVMLGELTRRACPLGAGAVMRLSVERGDPEVVLPRLGAGAEVLITSRGGESDR
jgi:Universal stress protein family